MNAPRKVRGVYEKVPGSGVWWIRYHEDGKPKRKKIGSFSLACQAVEQARARVRLAKHFPELGPPPESKQVSLRDALEFTLEKSRAKNWKAERRLAERFCEWFPGFTIDKIDIGLLEEFQDYRLQSIKPTSFKREISLLSKMFSLAVKRRWVGINPVSLLELEQGSQFAIYIPTEEDIVALHQHLPPHAWMCCEVAATTGMRMSEQFHARRANLCFRTKILTLDSTKANRQQHVHLSPRALEVLRQILKLHDSEFIFPNQTGESPMDINNFRNRVFYPARDRAGVSKRFTWHCWRHYFASKLADEGHSPWDIKEALRHSSLKMTERYVHRTDRSVKAAVKATFSQPLIEQA